MKKETLIKVIDEEFGDGYPLSWVIDVTLKAIVRNDSKAIMATDSYNAQVKLVKDTLSALIDSLKQSEKETENKFEIKKPRGK